MYSREWLVIYTGLLLASSLGPALARKRLIHRGDQYCKPVLRQDFHCYIAECRSLMDVINSESNETSEVWIAKQNFNDFCDPRTMTYDCQNGCPFITQMTFESYDEEMVKWLKACYQRPVYPGPTNNINNYHFDNYHNCLLQVPFDPIEASIEFSLMANQVAVWNAICHCDDRVDGDYKLPAVLYYNYMTYQELQLRRIPYTNNVLPKLIHQAVNFSGMYCQPHVDIKDGITSCKKGNCLKLESLLFDNPRFQSEVWLAEEEFQKICYNEEHKCTIQDCASYRETVIKYLDLAIQHWLEGCGEWPANRFPNAKNVHDCLLKTPFIPQSFLLPDEKSYLDKSVVLNQVCGCRRSEPLKGLYNNQELHKELAGRQFSAVLDFQ